MPVAIWFILFCVCVCVCEDVALMLFSACQSGNASKIKELVEQESYTWSLLEVTHTNHSNARNIAEKTIYTAALRGHYESVQVLIQAGVNVNAQTSLGTPVYAAVKSGNFDLLCYLIKKGADFKSPQGGFSPIYVACIEGQLRILRYLVSIGASIFEFSNPPLVFTACSAGQMDTLRYLMEEMNWNVNQTMSGEKLVKTDGKDTLLYTACSRNKLDIAGYLVQQGASITQMIVSRFPQIIKHILQQRFRPIGPALPTQLYHARLKEMGLAELPWPIMADYVSTIARLELRGNHLVGLPPEVFQMPALNVLDLCENQISVLSLEDVKWTCRRCVCVWVCGCMHVCVCMCVWMHACMCVCMCVCVHVCVCHP